MTLIPQQFTRRYPALIALLISMCVGAFLATGCSTAGKRESDAAVQRPVKIAVLYLSQHELISQMVDGFREQIKLEMPGTAIEIIEKHASGDMSAVSPMVNAAIAQQPTMIVPLTTPPSQIALKNAPPSIPICFLGVTDPVGAGIVKSLEKPELSTGVVDLPPIDKILGLIRQLIPSATKIAFPYSPDEQPAVFTRDMVVRLAPKYGFSVSAKPVASVDELAATIRALARTNDVFLTGADNKMFDQAAQVAKVSLDTRKPFFAGDSTSIKAGAVAGLSVDYRAVGKEGAKLAARILKGERAGTIPVKLLTEGNLEINDESVRRLGLSIPDEIRKQAKKIY